MGIYYFAHQIVGFFFKSASVNDKKLTLKCIIVSLDGAKYEKQKVNRNQRARGSLHRFVEKRERLEWIFQKFIRIHAHQ